MSEILDWQITDKVTCYSMNFTGTFQQALANTRAFQTIGGSTLVIWRVTDNVRCAEIRGDNYPDWIKEEYRQ